MKAALSILLLLVALLFSPTHQAISEEADAAIKQAIKVAILDGLDTIDKQMRSQYWYYLRGAQRISFNVSLLPTKLNYIIVYNSIGNIYRVNCDIIKITWSPSLNSFVKILNTDQTITSLKANISMMDANSSVVDLTDHITISGGEDNSTKIVVPAIPATPAPIIVITPVDSISIPKPNSSNILPLLPFTNQAAPPNIAAGNINLSTNPAN